MSSLQKLKSGKKNYKLIDFPGTDEKVALVILSSDQLTQCKLKSDQYCESKGIEDEGYKNIVFQEYLVYESLRDKDDINKRLAESVDDLRSTLDAEEISYIAVQYNMFASEVSPFLGAITDEQFELLKKSLEKMSLKDLNGESLVALRNFLISLK